jgi:magnesium chelatase family protein
VAEIKQHWKRLGGALLDRVDMRLPLEPVPPAVLLGGSATAQDDDAAEFVAIVARAVATQRDRYADVRWSRNGRLPAGAVARYCQLDSGCREEIAATAGLVQLSSRAIHSIARLARTVADIDGATPIAAAHVAEAIQYRRYGDNNLYWPFD